LSLPNLVIVQDYDNPRAKEKKRRDVEVSRGID